MLKLICAAFIASALYGCGPTDTDDGVVAKCEDDGGVYQCEEQVGAGQLHHMRCWCNK